MYDWHSQQQFIGKSKPFGSNLKLYKPCTITNGELNLFNTNCCADQLHSVPKQKHQNYNGIGRDFNGMYEKQKNPHYKP